MAPPAVTFTPKEIQFASTNVPSASDPLVFTIRVRADIEIKVFAGHTHALHESDNLVFDTLANSRARPNGIARIGVVWRIAALARIDHPKVSITLNENRIHIFKRQDINAGTAARLGGLRQSDIRAKRALAHINAPAHSKPKSSIIRLEIETSIELFPSTMAFRMPKRQLHHCRRPPKYKTWSTLLIVRHDFRAIGNVVINPFCILNFQTHTPGR